MPKRCQQLIDYLRYSDARKIVEAEILLTDCTRLLDLVSPESDLEQTISFKFEFGIDELANRFLKGQVKSQLKLTCQRCMKGLDYSIALDLALAFIKTKQQEQDIAGLYDSYYIENKDPIDLYALVEDEVILSLPLIAKHQDENCLSNIETIISTELDEIDKAYLQEQENIKNPFAILEQLKK